MSDVEHNDDEGVCLHSETSSYPFNTGEFGGSFLSARTSNRITTEKAQADSSYGPRFTLSLEHSVVGGHGNGPGQARVAMWGVAEKKNWQNSQKTGEVDVAYFHVRQGVKDDAGGILIDAAKVFNENDPSGGLTAIEGASARINQWGVCTDKVRFIPGFQEGIGGAMEGRGASFYAEAEVGNPTAGVAVVNHTGSFRFAFAAYAARNPYTRYFSVSYDGNTKITLGLPNFNISVLVDALGYMHWRNQNGNANLLSLSNQGHLSALNGVRVADGSVLVTRELRSQQKLSFAYIPAHNTQSCDIYIAGAQRNDFCHVNATDDYVTDKIIFTGRVIGRNMVRVMAHNHGKDDLPPSIQTVIVWIKGGV